MSFLIPQRRRWFIIFIIFLAIVTGCEGTSGRAVGKRSLSGAKTNDRNCIILCSNRIIMVSRRNFIKGAGILAAAPLLTGTALAEELSATAAGNGFHKYRPATFVSTSPKMSRLVSAGRPGLLSALKLCTGSSRISFACRRF